MPKRKRTVTITLPDEFLDLCDYDMVAPHVVLRGFIADLCGLINWQFHPRADGYNSNGSDERSYARAYYDRVGYSYDAQAVRENPECTLCGNPNKSLDHTLDCHTS